MSVKLTRNKSYSFNSFTNVGRRSIGWKVQDEVSYATARLLGFDVDATHARVIGQLPKGTTADATKLTYYIFRNTDNRTECLADVWIQEDGLEEFSRAEVHVVVKGSLMSTEDVTRIRRILTENGYTEYSVDLVSV